MAEKVWQEFLMTRTRPEIAVQRDLEREKRLQQQQKERKENKEKEIKQSQNNNNNNNNNNNQNQQIMKLQKKNDKKYMSNYKSNSNTHRHSSHSIGVSSGGGGNHMYPTLNQGCTMQEPPMSLPMPYKQLSGQSMSNHSMNSSDIHTITSQNWIGIQQQQQQQQQGGGASGGASGLSQSHDRRMDSNASQISYTAPTVTDNEGWVGGLFLFLYLFFVFFF